MPGRVALGTSVLVALTFVFAAAQQLPPGAPVPGVPARGGQVPPRAVRPGEDPQKGTSILRGYVVAAGTGQPLRRALVRAMSQEGRNSGMALTDAQGRFEIADLPGGRYNINVSKAGYVSMSYGQRRPEQPGTMLEILDGQLAEKIAFALPRGGVITGTVLDEFGEPVAGAQVSAMRFRYFNGARRLMPSGGGGTDDRGVFRIYGLVPGDYYVSAGLRSPQAMVAPGGVTTSNPLEGYAPTYFPGTANPNEASRLTVRAADETANVSFSLISARLARVSGRATTSAGAPVVQGFITMMPADRLSSGTIMSMTSAITRADGSFQMLGVAPGTYNVMLRPRGMPTPDAEFANMRITVGQGDLDGVLLVSSRGALARGIVTTDENTPLPVLPQQVTIFARPTDPEVMIMGGDSRVDADWTFEISGLSEPRLITGNIAESDDWTLKAVMHNGIDVTDTPIEFVPGRTVEGLQLIFSRKRTEISGRISGDRETPDTDATVIVFSEDPARWGFASRYVRSARPSQDGRYSLRGMPPHDYLLAVVKDIEPGQWQDPEFLESLRAQAIRVSLNEGDSRVQDLKTTRP